MINKKILLRTIIILLLVVISMTLYGFIRLERSIIYPSMPVEIKAEFLSENYFNELSEQYKQIRSGYREWYLIDDSKAIASHAILTHMMEDLLENPNLLSND